MGASFMPLAPVAGPRLLRLLSPGGWSFYVAAAAVLFVAFPILHLVVPADSALHPMAMQKATSPITG